METTVKVIAAATVILAAVGFAAVINFSLGESDKMDCLTWQQEATQYSQFYLTKDEAAQCQSYNIVVNAPVK